MLQKCNRGQLKQLFWSFKSVRMYIKTDGKRNNPHLSYAFHQEKCSKNEFSSNHKGHTGDKLGVVQKGHFYQTLCFIVGSRKVKKFFADIYYIIS